MKPDFSMTEKEAIVMGNNSNEPGYYKAIASLVLGVIGVILLFFGVSTIISMILGIIGLVLAWIAIIFCVVRGLPVLFEAGSVLK